MRQASMQTAETAEKHCCPKVRELLDVEAEMFAAFTRGFDAGEGLDQEGD